MRSARPRHVGIAYRCAACNEPRFVRAVVRAIDAERAELGSHLVEIERPRERFPFSYLPEDVELLFREALDCYTAGCHNAFASMCRRTMQAAMAAADGRARQRLRDACADVVQLGGLSEALGETLQTILFSAADLPSIGAEEAAVLVEVMKDLLYQHYVRVAKLRAAIKMRRWFANEGANVTPIRRRESA
ncbi:MAG TPA: hypothetical protein VIN61_01540 [Gammaproteobacteria bacterium]